jgi:hypothetical protein
MESTQYLVVRPSEYDVAPTYRPSVVESHLSKYVLEVDPLSFDKNRASFSYRSPGLGTLQKSTVEIAFTLRIGSRLPINFVANMGANLQIVANSQNFNAHGNATLAGATPKIAFGSGDAMQGAISSLQIVVNGASISQVRQRDYMRSLQKAWFSPRVFQRRFNECGGTPQAYDSVAVSGETLNLANLAVYDGTAANTATISGFTGDSGTRDRLKNIMACQIGSPVVAANSDFRDIRVRWKVNGTGLFSPLAVSDRISHSCPYKQSARALPNMNVVSINILFEDLFKAIVRNLSTTNSDDQAQQAATLAAGGSNAITVAFPPAGAQAKMYVEFLRLPGWRRQVDRAQLQTFRVAVHDPTTDDFTNAVAMPAALLDNLVGIIPECLPPTGVDRLQGSGAQAGDFGKRACSWRGITAAQIPEYLFVCCQKRLDLTNHEALLDHAWRDPRAPAQHQPYGDAAHCSVASAQTSQYLARNSDGNLAISRFQLEIMSVQGSYIYSSEDYPYVKTKQDLYRDCAKYMVPDGDDYDTWLKHNCIILLGVQEYAKGISSSGTAFPCTFTVNAEFENRRQFVDGYGCKSLSGKGLGAAMDVIGGRPVLGMIYPQQRLEVTASSALLTSQNISHASASEILARKY